MIDDNDRILIKELKERAGFFMARVLCSQEKLAKKLGINDTYLSAMLNERRPVSKKVLLKLKELCQDLDNKSITPERVAIQENLPLHPNPLADRVARLENLLDEEKKTNTLLIGRVAVLERDGELAKNDSEKKIRGIVKEAIRAEVERYAAEIADRPAGRREAAG